MTEENTPAGPTLSVLATLIVELQINKAEKTFITDKEPITTEEIQWLINLVRAANDLIRADDRAITDLEATNTEQSIELFKKDMEIAELKAKIAQKAPAE